MFPQERAAEFGMAVVAGAVDGAASEQLLGVVAVRAVAVGAGHLAVPHRVSIRLHRLRALVLVAVEAHLGLGRRRENRVALGVHGMAVDAGDRVVVMLAAMPGEAGLVEMAFHAIAVLLLNGTRRVEAERRYRRALLATPDTARVVAGRPVTGLALQLAVAKRRARVLGIRVLGPEDRQHGLVVMALEAGVRTVLAVLTFVSSSRGGGDGQEGHRQHRSRSCSQ